VAVSKGYSQLLLKSSQAADEHLKSEGEERPTKRKTSIGEITEKKLREDAENKSVGRKGKGRDIGYALAVNSCEGAGDVESCTITAFDVITAFAVPNPGHILAE
jgi:hypothetical protein